MGIRPARTIRNPKKVPWTRFSKNPTKSYIKTLPHSDLHQFRMGVEKPDFDITIHLVSQQAIVVRDNAIESARQSANKYLEKVISGDYFLMVNSYPHHIIRENKMIAGAGADRLQKGMRASFGRPTDRAARLAKGTRLFTARTYKKNLPHILTAFERARRRLSGKYKTVVA
ncbi:MAG: 50S ribosomal protein L16 [Candidatus Bilamarchaeaceae archaeon]